MSQLLALVMAAALAAGMLGSPAAFAQAAKGVPAKAEVKAPEKKVELIDINTAPAEELQALKGIGDAFAKKIIANRPYKGKDELVSRSVIPEATYQKIKGQIIAKQSPGAR